MADRPLDIAVVAAFDAPFIRDDIEILSRHYRVRAQIGHGFSAVWKIFWLVLRCDVVFCWFASAYAAFAVRIARILGLRSFVVIGGVDVTRDPEIGYGAGLNPRKARRAKYALRNAWRVLSVDPSLHDDAMAIGEYDGRNIVYCPTGYDSDVWKPVGAKMPLVLTVAAVADMIRARVKGIDLLVEAARRLSEVRFLLVGMDDRLRSQFAIPDNLEVRPACRRNELVTLYQSARVYCLPSRREGLPNALCEAMLCGCIPVAADVGGAPTAVGQAGILVPPGDVDALVAGIVRGLAADERSGVEARARIVSLFPRAKREGELLRLLREASA